MVWQVLKGDHVASGRCCIQLFMNSLSQEEALGHLGHAKVISCDYNVHTQNSRMITHPTTSSVDS
jgi:hypothetical protein